MTTDCKTEIKRPTCIVCALKHLGQAWVIYLETYKGYPEFKYLLMAHMAEAEDELAEDHTEQANKIREHRTAYAINEEYKIPFRDMIKKLADYDSQVAQEQLRELSE